MTGRRQDCKKGCFLSLFLKNWFRVCERETLVCSIFYAFIGWFLHVPWLEWTCNLGKRGRHSDWLSYPAKAAMFYTVSASSSTFFLLLEQRSHIEWCSMVDSNWLLFPLTTGERRHELYSFSFYILTVLLASWCLICFGFVTKHISHSREWETIGISNNSHEVTWRGDSSSPLKNKVAKPPKFSVLREDM